ncbi:MAG: hypothetical protein UT24_C0018G0008 [Candidatus Woesebacteria bacterium GW2011_GWB1_39_12]|uniref:Uncharacterized protein n=1 Tax=Candidatus Woesebacteria bacterium GW2011_GWB1_39_12 TaxID=1618574 RepID=A0A0G0MI22_9BACT|nr:MAG: hypothetical protein UT24_C0018G0008 [Candidatus Woesebacteria bacterium GW2011_GWB1_39_12]
MERTPQSLVNNIKEDVEDLLKRCDQMKNKTGSAIGRVKILKLHRMLSDFKEGLLSELVEFFNNPEDSPLATENTADTGASLQK